MKLLFFFCHVLSGLVTESKERLMLLFLFMLYIYQCWILISSIFFQQLILKEKRNEKKNIYIFLVQFLKECSAAEVQ